jgi:hypothetical protein
MSTNSRTAVSLLLGAAAVAAIGIVAAPTAAADETQIPNDPVRPPGILTAIVAHDRILLQRDTLRPNPIRAFDRFNDRFSGGIGGGGLGDTELSGTDASSAAGRE